MPAFNSICFCVWVALHGVKKVPTNVLAVRWHSLRGTNYVQSAQCIASYLFLYSVGSMSRLGYVAE